MALTIGTPNLEPNMSNGSVGVKVAQLAKEQQQVEGDIALQLIQAAEPAAPVGNAGHNVNIKV